MATSILSLRFLTAVGLTITSLTCLASRNPHVVAALSAVYTAADYTAADTAAISAHILITLGPLVNFAGIFTGVTVFRPLVNLFYIVDHGLGAMWLLAYTMQPRMDYRVLWYIFLWTSLPVLVFELAAIAVQWRLTRLKLAL
ncbi:hypothetical protein AMAG_07408 [Allomyces macrogynus ATCC 38327]|uniref:Transmembrane protein 107 n=1 Tax=Allomyces macrogynus (strain ATCC 38327) TaxID=578462 RepID=A0A0L0SI13_ALLM3|nr:hypothetical protein AMAG_07408 [Allomyces macrogynus ATCC 38327]|eukprot:KNE62163.1 hypothetical protein AMAG_07408 [Allomyces macrogynus ATCC 38327]